MRREKTLMEGSGLTACLENLRISEACYTKEFGNLRAKGYSEIEAQTAILRKSSKNTVETLLALHDALIAQEFTRAELVKIAGHTGGSRNLESVLTHARALINLGFPREEIGKIAGNNGGSHNLRAVLIHARALINLGFPREEIVKIAGHDGGSRNLKAVLTHAQALIDLGFPRKEIGKIAGHIGGSCNLKAVLIHAQALIDLGFPRKEIGKIAGNNCGSRNLEAVLKHFNVLQQLGFSRAQMVRCVARDSGSIKLNALGNYCIKWQDRGLTPENMIKYLLQPKRSAAAADLERTLPIVRTTQKRECTSHETLSLGSCLPAMDEDVEVLDISLLSEESFDAWFTSIDDGYFVFDDIGETHNMQSWEQLDELPSHGSQASSSVTTSFASSLQSFWARKENSTVADNDAVHDNKRHKMV